MKRASQLSWVFLNLAFGTALLVFCYIGYQSFQAQQNGPSFFHGNSKVDASPAKATSPSLTVRTT